MHLKIVNIDPWIQYYELQVPMYAMPYIFHNKLYK
jgi:hypothetical protein